MAWATQQRLRAAALHVGVWFAYVALAVLLTWPLAQHLTDHVLNAPYSWDALTNTMILGTRVHNALGIGAGGAYDAYFFAPIPHTIAFNENLFGLSLLFGPLYLVTHEPILAYNLTLLWSLSLSGYFTFLLVRQLARDLQTEAQDAPDARLPVFAAFLAGAAFAFCPYVVFEIGRIQLVATQWMPLCLLMLHRAIVGRRWIDFVGLGIAFALQVGTCLYYALFLLPILILVLAVVVLRRRAADLRLLLQLALSGALAAALIVPMIAPYFEVREHIDLTRDEDYAQKFDGKLNFLANVYVTNRVWVPLRHRMGTNIATEEIAFPGLLVALLSLLSVALPFSRTLRSVESQPRRRLIGAGLFLAVMGGLGALGATAATGTMLGGAAVLWLVVTQWRAVAGNTRFLPSVTSLYFFAALVSLTLFLGLEPMRVNGEPAHGLYYYLFTYVPGFDGIRKVSRQAIVVMLVLAVLAGLGATLLLGKVRRARWRYSLGVALVAVVVLETYSAPMKLVSVPAGNSVPDIYHYIATHRQPGALAVIPARDGRRVYRGHPGQALHNYQSLYHRHRTINGKSSWIPPVTRLFDDYMNRFPSPTATKLLLALGTRQLVVHAGDFGPERAERVLNYLDTDTEHYKLIVRTGSDSLYYLRTDSPDEGWLVPTPGLPVGAVQVEASHLTAAALVNPRRVRDAFDGDPGTFWTTQRTQRRGDWFELNVADERPIAAIEIEPGEHTLEVPLSFEISATDPTFPMARLRPVLVRPWTFFYEQQVFTPKTFVWRVLLPEPIAVRRLRITLREATPNQAWVIPEIRLWASTPAVTAAREDHASATPPMQLAAVQ